MSDRPVPNMDADEVARRVTATIQDLLSETGGGMLNGFVIFVDYYNDKGEPCWAWGSLEGQRVAQTAGYLDICKQYVKSAINDLLFGGEE